MLLEESILNIMDKFKREEQVLRLKLGNKNIYSFK